MRANVDDLATFFSARERADCVDAWLAERQQLLREQAAGRRREHRVQCGRALRAMRDRGESVREIARMAGVAEKAARELIREADGAAGGESAWPAPSGAAGDLPAGGRVAGRTADAARVNVCQSIPNRAAIPLSVSPGWTMYRRAVAWAPCWVAAAWGEVRTA